MNKYGLAMMALILVSGVIAIGFIFMIPDVEEGEWQVTYHGNGGLQDGDDKIKASNEDIIPCPFTNGDMVFYKWNSEPDGSGSFYAAGHTDADRLAEDKVRDLYAVWTYSLNISYTSSGSSLNLYPLSIVLVQNGSFLDSQGYLYGNDLFLDPSKGTARLGFASEDRSVEWTYDPASVTFTGVSEKLTYKVAVSGISGASDITYSGSSDGMTAFDFSYGGNVHMDIAVSSA